MNKNNFDDLSADRLMNNWKTALANADNYNPIPYDAGGIANGVFSQITVNEPWSDPIKEIESRLKKLETENKFLRLKILSIEGKFTQEEVANIRKMLISEDESSRTLAESIIDNA
jgi:hypothetical protein